MLLNTLFLNIGRFKTIEDFLDSAFSAFLTDDLFYIELEDKFIKASDFFFKYLI